MKLQAHAVEKPWGRTDLASVFGGPSSTPIGEIWFEGPAAQNLPLLVKYIFTSEKLSVQVHPDDEQARGRGLPRGKNECWYILDAEEGATLGLGLKAPTQPEKLRAAAVDGSIEELMHWQPVAPGDFYYVPAGTVHAIGAGIMLLELQQNADVTYRLYDYGRPRELHLDDGIAVSQGMPYSRFWSRPAGEPVETVLHNGPHFCLVRSSSNEGISTSLSDRLRWVMPLKGKIWSEKETAKAGECLLLHPGEPLSFSHEALVLIGAEGSL